MSQKHDILRNRYIARTIIFVMLSMAFSLYGLSYAVSLGVFHGVYIGIALVMLFGVFYFRRKYGFVVFSFIIISLINIVPLLCLVLLFGVEQLYFSAVIIGVVMIGVCLYVSVSAVRLCFSFLFGAFLIAVCSYAGFMILVYSVPNMVLLQDVILSLVLFKVLTFSIEQALDHAPDDGVGGSLRSAVEVFLVSYILIWQIFCVMLWAGSLFRFNYVGKPAGAHLNNDNF